jgi:hypothetical protein
MGTVADPGSEPMEKAVQPGSYHPLPAMPDLRGAGIHRACADRHGAFDEGRQADALSRNGWRQSGPPVER